MIDKYGEYIISDLSTYHGIKPWEIIEGPYSPRQLLAFVQNLPFDSATMAQIRGGPEFRAWDAHMYMLANLVDAVNQTTYVVAAANAGKRKPKPPKPIDRPKAGSKQKPGGGLFAQMARTAYFAQQKKGSNNGGTGRD